MYADCRKCLRFYPYDDGDGPSLIEWYGITDADIPLIKGECYGRRRNKLIKGTTKNECREFVKRRKFHPKQASPLEAAILSTIMGVLLADEGIVSREDAHKAVSGHGDVYGRVFDRVLDDLESKRD